MGGTEYCLGSAPVGAISADGKDCFGTSIRLPQSLPRRIVITRRDLARRHIQFQPLGPVAGQLKVVVVVPQPCLLQVLEEVIQ